jgi:branched-chain amino acid transport system substrate-binding protein
MYWFAEGFFVVAAAQTPKPTTVALCGADAEFPRNAMDGARAVIKRLGLKIVYDKTYPPATSDYTPVIRAIAATNPDIFLACSYPADTVGLIRASHEVGFKPKVYGGGMVGLQATAIKMQLGPLLNGIITYDFWLPWAGFASDEGREFVKKYQTRSAEAGVDLLGYYLPPFAYARMQLIEQAVKAVGSADDAKLAEFARKNTFKTVVGDVKFNEDGEWAEAQVMAVQFQGVSGNGVEQFKDPKTEVILWPTKYKTGNVIYPYDPKK